MPKGAIARSWLTTLRQQVESKPCVLLRLNESGSERLNESRHGFKDVSCSKPTAVAPAISHSIPAAIDCVFLLIA